MTPRWTIRAKLAALVLAVLLPLVAGAGYKFWRDLGDERAHAQQHMVLTAQVLARHLDEIVTGQLEHLEALAAPRPLDRIQEADLQAVAGRVAARHPFIHRFLVARPDGRITASSARGGAPEIGADVLAGALGASGPRIGTPRREAGTDRVIVPVVTTVRDPSGAAVGVVALEIDLGRLSVFLDRLRLGDGISVALVTTDGVLVARSGVTSLRLGEPLPPASGARTLAQGGGGVVTAHWMDGVLSLAGTAPMSAAPWTVVATMPSDLAYGPAVRELSGSLLGLGALMLAALTMAWLISRRMARSVQVLTDGARGLATGEGAPIEVETADELAEVAAQMNRVVRRRRSAEAASESRQRRIQALAEINLSLSRQLDIERLLEQITQALARLTGARNVVLWEVDHARVMLARRAWTSHETVPMDLPLALTLDEGATGWIARHRQPLFIEDIAGDARIMAADWALRHEMIAFAGVPVIAGQELLGVLTLNLVRGTLPEGDDRALLSTFAAQAAVAIRNARLFAEADRRRRAAEALSDLGRTLAQVRDPDVVAQRIANGLGALLGVQSCALYRLEPGSGDLCTLAVSGSAVAGFDRRTRYREGTGVVGLAVGLRRATATPDVLGDSRVTYEPEIRRQIEAGPYRAILAAPLVVKDSVIGVIAVGDREGRVFDGEELRIAQAFADQAALALDNARLYEETSQRLRHLDSLRDVVEQILVPVSLDERLTVIARKTAELFDADRVTVALRDDERGQLVVRAGYGMLEGEIGRVVAEGVGLLGTAAARRQGLLVNDYLAWPARDPFIVQEYATNPARAVIACPLLIREQTIGSLAVGLHGADGSFVPGDLDRLASLAVPAALAIEHSRLYEELASRLRELQETQEQLVQAGKLSAVGQLVSGVAHELNNPLSVVIGYGQILLGRELPAEMRRPVELIVAQGDRMAKIVQNLLLFSRQRRPERAAVDVREAMEQTIGLRATQLMLSGIHVETVYDDGVPAAEGDVHQLQQVFLNLLLNAEQAILGSGVGERRVGDHIRIATASRVENGRTWVVVQVADNGPGIAPDVLPRIFDPFFTTKKVGEGTGLGLSVSYGIVQQHGGRLTAESQAGRTAFTIELPATTRGADAAPRPDEPSPVAGQGRRALVVDDEESVVELVTALLRQAGWRVDVAGGGHAALERLRHDRYDLVVSDVRMPDGNGAALYRMATAECRGLAERFLFMTGDTANPEAWDFLQRSKAEVLEKPFTAQALLHAVERVVAE